MRFFIPSLILCISLANNVFASAWTQEKGKGIAIVNARYYHTSSFFNESGERQPMNAYSKHELNPYAEYGLYDGLTIGTNLSLQHAVQFGDPAATNQQSFGIGDSEFFVRKRLWKRNGFSFTAQPLIKIPSPSNKDMRPKIGGDDIDLGLMLAGGYGFKLWGLDHFVEAEGGMRHRFGESEDQLRFNATAGIAVTEKWMVMPQAFVTMRAQKPEVALFTQASSDDYSLTTLQLTAVYKYRDDIWLQGGAFVHVSGRNVGNGDGLILSVWKKF